jgi:hypothetical protein
VELMDNCDSTLSVFGTLLDHAGPIAAPPAGSAAGAFGTDALASVGRTLSFNDPQLGGSSGGPGDPDDRNVELLIADPRTGPAATRRIRVHAKRRGGRVRIRVTDASGRVLRGARVRLAGRRATTNRKGRVTLKLRAGRRLRVRAVYPNACRPHAATRVR